MKIGVIDIKKKYGKKTVLDGVTFETESSRIVGILGVNGSGKSTLLGILSGVIGADSGDFTADGASLFKDRAKRENTVGYIPQGTPLIEELSARDNLLLWYTKDAMKAELERGVLKMLGIDEFIGTRVSRMSGGMKKRLSIGCAVANSPEVILLDEPTSALDVLCREEIRSYLLKFKEAGGIAILATHDLSEIDLCDDVYVLKNGKLIRIDRETDGADISGILKR